MQSPGSKVDPIWDVSTHSPLQGPWVGSQPLSTTDTLVAVLERDTLGIREVRLFNAVVRWSEAECQRQQLQVTPENKRKVLGKALGLIRFPLMTIEEFAAGNRLELQPLLPQPHPPMLPLGPHASGYGLETLPETLGLQTWGIMSYQPLRIQLWAGTQLIDELPGMHGFGVSHVPRVLEWLLEAAA